MIQLKGILAWQVRPAGRPFPGPVSPRNRAADAAPPTKLPVGKPAPAPSPTPAPTAKPDRSGGPLAADKVMQALRSAFGSVEGDKNWNAEVDFDKDGEITVGDFSLYSESLRKAKPADEFELLRRAFGSVKGEDRYDENLDLDKNGEIDIGDFALLSERKANEDRKAKDLAAFRAAYGATEKDKHWNAAYDLDGNGEIDIGDYSLLSAKYA